MKHRLFFFLCIQLGFLLSFHLYCYGQKKARKVEPRVDKILRQMGDYLRTAEQYTFHANATFEKVSDTGQKIQYGEAVYAAVRRPDRLYAENKGDLINHCFWYDGKSITMLDTELNIYANTEAPTDIDSALGFAANHLGIVAPLGDLVVSDPYTSVIQNVRTGVYIGLHSIHGIPCNHLAFVQENLDWQIWIEDGRMKVPRKVVITYKKEEGAPQYTAILSDWNFSPHLPDSVFTFIAPDNAEEIEFLSLEKKVPEKID